MQEALTAGCHHIGLTVSRLEASADFFTRVLGWREVRRDADYPAIFVTDGTLMLTLWAIKTTQPARPFDKDHQVGLHHVAFRVDSDAMLDTIHARLAAEAEVRVEFTPETLRGGPARHMMCYEPSGNRVEFIWPG